MAKKPRRGKGDPIPWEELETRWVEGGNEVTHRLLAAEYNLESRQVGHYASENHWSVKRLAYRSQLRRAISERVFARKVDMGVEVRMIGIRDRIDHLRQLVELREAVTAVKLMKVREGEDDAVYEYETAWSSSDHANHRKTFDACEEGLYRSLGVAEGFIVTAGGELRVYIPRHGGALPVESEDDGAPESD